jgi:hypothetical protein
VPGRLGLRDDLSEMSQCFLWLNYVTVSICGFLLFNIIYP